MKNVREFLARLSEELRRNEDFDIETRQLLQELHNDVDRIEAAEDVPIEPVLDRVREIESKFASNHPILERTARELADALAKMGI